MEEVIKRIEEELKDLEDKIVKLGNFKKTDTYKNLNPISAELLNSQLDIMIAYRSILMIRYSFLKAEDE